MLRDCPTHGWRPTRHPAHQFSSPQSQTSCQQHGSPLYPKSASDPVLPKNLFRRPHRDHQLRWPPGLALGPLSQSYRGQYAHLWTSSLPNQLWFTEKRTRPGYRLYRCCIDLWAQHARRHASFPRFHLVGGASLRGSGRGLCGVSFQKKMNYSLLNS